MANKNDEKLLRFRLVAEMENSQLHAVNLSQQQQIELHNAIENIVGDEPLSIHAVPFGTTNDMVPRLN